MLSSNAVSGTVSAEFASFLRLSFFDISVNQISGSSSPAFANWTNLILFSVFSNPLNFDLGLVQHWPDCVYVLAQDCSIDGHVPARSLSNGQHLTKLLLMSNSLSGTLSVDSFANTSALDTFGISSNKISGLLPNWHTCEGCPSKAMQTVLASSTFLSGSMPTTFQGSRRQANLPEGVAHNPRRGDDRPTQTGVLESQIKTMNIGEKMQRYSSKPFVSGHLTVCWSVGRNYFRGDTSFLDNAPNLTTVIISANYFSCNMANMEASVNLGENKFEDPTVMALLQVGIIMADIAPYINPFASLVATSYMNIALSFSGNTELTADASIVPSVEAGKSLREDQIKSGRKALFAGHFNFTFFFCVLLPATSGMYLTTVIITLWSHQQKTRRCAQEASDAATNTVTSSVACTPVVPASSCAASDSTPPEPSESGRCASLAYSLQCYLSPQDTLRQDPRILFLLSSTRVAKVWGLCGVLLTALNLATGIVPNCAVMIHPELLSGSIFTTHGGCAEPLLRTCVSGSVPGDQLYQWCFVLLQATLQGLLVYLYYKMLRQNRVDVVCSVHNCINMFLCGPSSEQVAVRNWYKNMTNESPTPDAPGRKLSILRRIAFWLLLFPFLLLASIPAIGYV